MPDAAATAHTLNRYDRFAPFYDLAEWPVEYFLFRTLRASLWRRVRGPEVLELGIGTGKNVPYYPGGVRVTGVDLSPRMLERARLRARERPDAEVALDRQDVERLAFPDAVFDEVVATFVFCSVPDPVRGLSEAMRVVKPGGRLRLLEHMRAEAEPLGRMMDALDAPVHRLTGVHIARRTVENVRRAGWAVDRVEPVSRFDIVRRIDAHRPA